VTRRFFTAQSPDNARAALLHTAHLWRSWSYLTRMCAVGHGGRAGGDRRPRRGLDRGIHRSHAS
jgi:hypothetical protein